jgi:hypothetical protein
MSNAHLRVQRPSSTPRENSIRERFFDLFIKRQDLSKMLFMNDLYKKIIDVHGIIIEFRVRWGNNLALFESFRGIYEPFNLCGSDSSKLASAFSEMVLSRV